MMKQVLSEPEFVGWLHYLRNEPPSIQEQQMAILTTIVVNSMGGKAKYTDFLISKFDKTPVQRATAYSSLAAIAKDYEPPTS